MLSLLTWQTPTPVLCKQNRAVCVWGGRWTNLSFSVDAVMSHSLSHTHTHTSARFNSTVCCGSLRFWTRKTSLTWSFSAPYLSFSFFFKRKRNFDLCRFTPNSACRVLFDPCQLSLKPYVFSWHLYHNVGLIQTQLSVCVRLCDFVSRHRGIFAWLLVAALPVCLYSSADLVTPKATMITERELRVRRHIWTHSVWYECWEFELCFFFFSQNLASTKMCLLSTLWW